MMGASYYAQAAAEGSTHSYLLMAGNLQQIDYFSRKHPWVLSWVLPSVTSSTGHSVWTTISSKMCAEKQQK